MTPAAQKILELFRSRGLRAGGFISFAEFGEAIVWEGGSVRDENVCRALQWLREHSQVIEMNAGLQLSEAGETLLYGGTGATLGQARPGVPETLVPNGKQVLFRARGEGVQTYLAEEKAGELRWVFMSPQALLYDYETGETVGTHSGGPTWIFDAREN